MSSRHRYCILILVPVLKSQILHILTQYYLSTLEDRCKQYSCIQDFCHHNVYCDNAICVDYDKYIKGNFISKTHFKLFHYFCCNLCYDKQGIKM